jgi:hypothetical protein
MILGRFGLRRNQEREGPMNRFGSLVVGALAFVAATTLSGCDQEIASEREVDVKDDGTVKSREKTVTRDSDGSTTVTEEKTTTKP